MGVRNFIAWFKLREMSLSLVTEVIQVGIILPIKDLRGCGSHSGTVENCNTSLLSRHTRKDGVTHMKICKFAKNFFFFGLFCLSMLVKIFTAVLVSP
jgi:hypothetical protein